MMVKTGYVNINKTIFSPHKGCFTRFYLRNTLYIYSLWNYLGKLLHLHIFTDIFHPAVKSLFWSVNFWVPSLARHHGSIMSGSKIQECGWPWVTERKRFSNLIFVIMYLVILNWHSLFIIILKSCGQFSQEQENCDDVFHNFRGQSSNNTSKKIKVVFCFNNDKIQRIK